MRALTWHGKRDVRVDTVPDPTHPGADGRDRARSPPPGSAAPTCTSTRCSDRSSSEGDILGHEPMGVVAEVGPGVTELQAGDRVVVPFNVSCGTCFMCGQGLHSQCETTQVHEYGTGAVALRLHEALRAGPRRTGRVPAGAVRQHAADQGAGRAAGRPVRLPVRRAAHRLAGGRSTRVPGPAAPWPCWASGRSATWPRGSRGTSASSTVIGVDLVPERLERARKQRRRRRSTCAEHGKDLGDVVRGLTGGRGPDAVIDAVGMEAHGSPVGAAAHKFVGLLPDAVAEKLMQTVGSTSSTRSTPRSTSSGAAARSRSAACTAGWPTRCRCCSCSTSRCSCGWGRRTCTAGRPTSCRCCTDADPLGVDDFATHRLPLSAAPEAYATFQKKQDGMVKTLIQPRSG